MRKKTLREGTDVADSHGAATASTAGEGSRHTPGPWQVVETCYDGTDDVGERRIFTTWEHGQLHAPAPVVTAFTSILPMDGIKPSHGVSISEVDARLIAAAPDLYAALKIALGRMDTTPIPDNWKALYTPAAQKLIEQRQKDIAQIHAALAKAEGR